MSDTLIAGLSHRQARLVALLIREHLGESIYSPKRTEQLDNELRSLLPALDEHGGDGDNGWYIVRVDEHYPQGAEISHAYHTEAEAKEQLAKQEDWERERYGLTIRTRQLEPGEKYWEPGL